MNTRQLLLTSLFLLSACGGGSGSDSDPPAAVAAPTSLSYPSERVLAVSQQITTITPSVTGSVTSYSITPALPAGLTLNASSGAISGTPTAGSPETTYTITATNAGGSTSATMVLTVIDSAPSISYGSTELKLVRGIPVTSISPQNDGGAVMTWTIDNALPSGLSFNTTDGTIIGTPTELSAPASYVITAENVVGADSIALTIGVESGVLLDLGLGRAASASYRGTRILDRDGNRVLGHDSHGHWALWDANTRANLAQGETRCFGFMAESCDAEIDVAGPTMALQVQDGLELRASSDGQLLSTIPRFFSWWKLASDGSYVAVARTDGLFVYSPSGEQLFSKEGNYTAAKAFAAPGELRLLTTAEGVQVLERISLPSGSSSTSSPLLGQAHSWFVDGEHFITNSSNTIWIYSADGTQEDSQTLPHIERLTGQGNWFWTYRTNAGAGIDIYEIDDSSSMPAINYPLFSGVLDADMKQVFAAADTILVEYEDRAGLDLIDLSGAAPIKTSYTDPVSDLLAFAAISSTDWIVLNDEGVVADVTGSTPSYFSYGAARDIRAGADFIAVATAADKIFYFEADTLEPAGTIDFGADKLQQSSDGSVLAAANLHGSEVTLKVFSLPTGNEISSLSTSGSTVLTDFALASSGEALSTARRSATSGQLDRAVTTVPGGTLLWTETRTMASDQLTEVAAPLSPSAVSVASPDRAPSSVTTSWVYTNGSLVGTAAGFPVAWLDENRLFVNRYSPGSPGSYTSAAIVNAQGQVLSTPTLPEIRRFQELPSDRIYAPAHNKIFSVITGETLWSSSSVAWGESGGVTGTHVIFDAGSMVRAEPY